MRRLTPRRLTRLAALTLPATLLASGVGGAGIAAATAPRGTDTVNVVGYSIVANAYAALEAAFQATPAGKNVVFNNSFGASTTQAENVVSGQPADVVNFSLVTDLGLLVNHGLVSPAWATSGAGKAEHGVVTDSYVVETVRPGNPTGVASWASLAKAGAQTVTPDPYSSGSARWNLLEVYESQIRLGRTPAQAYKFTNSVVKHVVAEPSSGSKSLTAFLAGTGNVLLAYEADALTAKAAAKPIDVVYPAQNILIQMPAALTSTGTSNKGARAFFAYLFSPAGQNVWAHNAFRPTLPSVARATAHLFPKSYSAKQLTTIQSLGGWTAVTNKFFSPNGIIMKIEAANGYTS
ncbi:MAG TPA: substrate-binding domain-containing protein [Acidimicrobiales bacterium]|jgi:sulfate transport system substrate-binding protein|nr:substrate-binding domain-containing protein [Acidimicrobiales bacterium]